MKSLVLSGGGSKGAFVGGMLEYMHKKSNKEWDLFAGTSTGSLLQLLVSLNDYDNLRKAYTSITLDDIYNISPFRKSDSPETAKINIISILRQQLIHREPTFGNNKKLKSLIKKFLPEEKFNLTRKNNKKLITCVTNLTKVREEYYNNIDCTYNEFIDWSWISTNAVPFTSLVKRNNDYYADGGFMEHMPIQIAIDNGATEIDCITTNPKEWSDDKVELKNSMQVLGRIIDVMMWEKQKRDFDVAKYRAKDKDVTLNVYYMPRVLTKNSMYFDKNTMNDWWSEGYNYMKNLKCDKIILKCKK